MASFLKRLFGSDASLFGDLASGDWAPVPAYATAQAANVVDWLLEGPPPRKESPPKEDPSVMRHLSPEERRIVSEQRGQRRRRNTFSRIVARLAHLPSQEEPCGPEPQHLVVEQARAPKDDWVEVLKRYGEHLTDAELAIIRGQLKP